MSYDTFYDNGIDIDDVQLKAGPCEYNWYPVGSEIEMATGAYQGSGRSGWVVIIDRKVVFVTSSNIIPKQYKKLNMFNNYGMPVDELNPVEAAVKAVTDEYQHVG